ncbi:SipW-dependent-type signal peptide-containing protein [Candidatus Shapirobacteria bacterium]|nr:SipW-dependent-type signal peptide-containing protein [Candidatus Shapirobacteria bacterium]
MRRIYLSVLAIAATLALVGGATYALFNNAATSGPNTFATGNADLQLRHQLNQAWADSYGGANWGNLYPGWTASYNVYLKNNSSSPITLKVRPEIKNTSGAGLLLDNIYLGFSWSDGSHPVGPWPLKDWISVDNNPYLEPVLPQGEGDGSWVVKFSIPTTAGNEIANQNITFDLVFNGIQVTP